MAKKSSKSKKEDQPDLPPELDPSVQMPLEEEFDALLERKIVVSEAPDDLLEKLFDERLRNGLQLVLLAALYAPISQLNLTPVYGAVPAAQYHRYGVVASFMLAFALRGYLPRWISMAVTPFCFWVPTIQFILFQYSSVFGNPWGPVITELLTCYPMVVVSNYLAIQYFDDLLEKAYGNAVPSMGVFVLFSLLHRACRSFISSITGVGFLSSRIGLQLIVASLYGMVLRRNIFLPSIPAVAFTLVANPHCSLNRNTEVLEGTLALYDYTLLERRESLTGYISVIEDNERGIRFMRCDHSLLGGEWISPPPSPQGVERKVGEPIYAIFSMLEAVRLVEPSPSPALEKKALNIGLGIGTAPSALIAHGIDTTILEIDPVVHEFAVKYFALPTNHSYYITDAVQAVESANSSEANSYDYIIHDVFTGGAEPVDLFTEEFLSGLHMLLKPEGVVAINYAGDLALPSASIIYKTVTSVFPSCRVFREDEAPKTPRKATTTGEEEEGDFTNMVFFCKKDTKAPITFRTPIEADFLGTSSRKEYLLPKHEIKADETFDSSVEVLRKGKTGELDKWQAKSALGHWKVMRTVLPDAIWENW